MRVISPRLDEQILRGEKNVIVCHQLLHQAVFLFGKYKFRIPAGQNTGLHIQCQIAEGKYIRMKFLAPPEHGADAGQQLPHVKGLGQIVVRPGIQSPDAVLDLRPGREQQDGRSAPVFPQRGEDFDSVFFRHHDVQNDPVVVAGQGVLVGVLTVVDGIDNVFVVREDVHHRFGKRPFILGIKQLHGVLLLKCTVSFIIIIPHKWIKDILTVVMKLFSGKIRIYQ